MAVDLPKNVLAEKDVLSLLMNYYNDYAFQIFSKLTEDHFMDMKHRYIFRAMLELFEKKEQGGLTEVYEQLVNNKTLSEVTYEYLSEVSAHSYNVARSNFNNLITIIDEKYLLRQILLYMQNTLEKYNENYQMRKNDTFITDVGEYLSDIEKNVTAVTKKRELKGFTKLKDVMVDLQDQLIREGESASGVIGVRTFSNLDYFTRGFQPGQMIILAARPGIGKTAFSLNLALKTFEKYSDAVIGIFCLEMTNIDLAKRLLCAKGETELKQLGDLVQTTDSTNQTKIAAAKLNSYNLYLDESTKLSLGDLVSKVRNLKKEHEDRLKYIIIDHIGLMSPDKKYESRRIEIESYSRGIKELALELKIPIIVVSQLSRNVEKSQQSREPDLSDLRDSGSLEQDADIVMFLNRAEEKKKDEEDPEDLKMDLIIKKNRNGIPGTARYLFKRKIMLFTMEVNQ
jgi:replicative DNA helicase